MAGPFSLGGIGDPCCCGTSECLITICVTGCASGPILGATVTVKSGSTTIATGTTASNGCVTLDVHTAGTYTILISKSGYTDYSTTQTVVCPHTYTYGLSYDSSLVTCFCINDFGAVGCNAGVPRTLTLNDGIGDITLTYFNASAPGGAGSQWSGCALRSATAYFGNAYPCTASGPDTQDIPIWFHLRCRLNNLVSNRFEVVPQKPVPCDPAGIDPAAWPPGATCANPLNGWGAAGFDFTPTGQTLQCQPFLYTQTQTFAAVGGDPNAPNSFNVYGAGPITWTVSE